MPRLSRTLVLMLSIYAVWALVVLAVHSYNTTAPASVHRVDLCPMKLVAGIPCPTCGGTRAVSELAQFNLPGAWRFNPLLSVLVPLAAVLIAMRLVTGRVICIRLNPRGRRAAWTAATFTLLLNWAWVLWIGN